MQPVENESVVADGGGGNQQVSEIMHAKRNEQIATTHP